MSGTAGFRIHGAWSRPDQALLDSFGGASSAQVADRMSRMGAMDGGIKPVWSSPYVIGAALTAWCHSGDNLMVHKAVSLAVPGDILVVNTQGNVVNSVFGELLGASSVRSGIRGVIIDGTVRDSDGLQRLRLPVYSRGLSPSGCNKDGGGEVGAVIACGGVAVRPGDVIIADQDGVTVVPLADARCVAQLAASQMKREQDRLAEIENGILTRPEIDERLRQFKVID